MCPNLQKITQQCVGGYKQKTPLMGVVSYGTNYFYMYAILKAQNQSVVLHFLQISFFKP